MTDRTPRSTNYWRPFGRFVLAVTAWVGIGLAARVVFNADRDLLIVPLILAFTFGYAWKATE